MDLTPTTEQQRLRADCRSWLEANLPWEYGVGLPPRHASLDDEVAFGRTWQRQLADGRWVGVTWPEAYGGRGAGALAHYLVQEELARARAPELVGRIGVNLVGPTLLAHGTEDQRRRWLPGILRADILFCQLFSEPGAGSDLASLATRALRSDADDGWVLDGQKVWTSYAQFADWGLCLARTNPDVRKQAGITAFAVDMSAPGVEVRPLRQITGESDFNEVFLGGVFVPDDCVIGEVDAGWQVSASTLAHERGTNPRQLVIHGQHLEEMLRLAAERGAFDDPHTAQRLAQAFVEVKLFQLHNWRSLSRLESGRPIGPEGSALKLYWSEMSQRLHRLALDVLGPAAPLGAGATDNPGEGEWQRSWLYYQAASIFAGTNEIQRTIIGERVLGLPREGERGVNQSRVGYDVDGPVATITLRRPDVANALDSATIDELDGALDRADADEAVRVVVLAAEGKHFCSGHDLKELMDGSDPWAAMRTTAEGKLRHEQVMYFDRCVRLRDFRKPTIAAVQGACSAAGLMLACMCDLIVAADDARFSNPVLRMSGAAVELLVEPWEMGPRKAKEFLLCARTLTADEAERYGMVNLVVPRDELPAAARAMADEVALVPPITAQAVKGSINAMVDRMGQRDSWRHHFMVHQFVSNTETALGLMRERKAGGMDHVKREQQ